MIDTAFTVTLFDINNSDDITDRVLGFSTTTTAPYGATGRASATLTLNNHDGAFTPDAGGTYSNVDYFAKAILIDVLVSENGTANPYSSNVFHGLITGFDLEDNGTNSIVTITCDDCLTVGSRSKVTTTVLSTASDSQIVNAGWRGSYVATSLPLLDSSEVIFGSRMMNLNTVVPAPYRVVSGDTTNLGQLLDTRIMPSGPFVLWPYLIRKQPFEDKVSYDNAVLNPQMNRQDDGFMTYDFLPRTFTFTSSPSAAGDLPIQVLKRGWTIDLLKNTAQVTKWFSIPTPVEQDVESTDSVNKHGTSAVVLRNSVHDENTDAYDTASRLANKFDTPRFVPRRLVTSTRVMANAPAGSADMVQYTLSNLAPLWQLFKIVYTPTGATSARTDYCCAVSRTINATPSNATVEFELIPAVDAFSFELDSAVLGILDENRLG